MTRSRRYSGPDVRDPEQRREAFAGLTQRQLRERVAERDRLLLPVYSVPQVEDSAWQQSHLGTCPVLVGLGPCRCDAIQAAHSPKGAEKERSHR